MRSSLLYCCKNSVPAEVETTRFGSMLSALMVLQDSAFPCSFSKSKAPLVPILGVQISYQTIATIRRDVWHLTGAGLDHPIAATAP